MPCTRLPNGELALGGVSLASLENEHALLVAGATTPAYVYDLDAMAAEAARLRHAFGEYDGHAAASHLMAYAIKANAAGAIIETLAAEGCGADVVSGAELALALRCGIAPENILFSGVAKTNAELDLAIGAGAAGIAAVQLESVEEIARVNARAHALGRVARVSLRVNPSVDREALATHAYIATGHDEAKFGIPHEQLGEAIGAIERAAHVRLVGVGAHIGSQLTSVDAYVASARLVFALARDLRTRFPLTFVSTGGGFGIDYEGLGNEAFARPCDFVQATRKAQIELGAENLVLACEPGRALVGAHGVLLASVIQRKVSSARKWLMIDAGMNDLMRPALYQARHRIEPVTRDPNATESAYRVVGPVCESSDDFGLHMLPDELLATESANEALAMREVAILDAGAYGFSMASRYNGRALPAEIFLKSGAVRYARAQAPTVAWVDDRLVGTTRR